MKNEIKGFGIKEIEKIFTETSKDIKKGLSEKLSSTGTPMSELKGAALYTARKAAIAGGSLETGGGGMMLADKIIENNIKSKTILKLVNGIKNKIIKYIKKT